MRAAAVEAGQDPGALEYTRWAPVAVSEADVAAYAEQGITRLVVGPSTADPSEQRDQVSALAERLKLG
jgi:hypothetical protein